MQSFNFNTCAENLGCLSIYKSEAVLYVYQSLQNMKIYIKKRCIPLNSESRKEFVFVVSLTYIYVLFIVHLTFFWVKNSIFVYIVFKWVRNKSPSLTYCIYMWIYMSQWEVCYNDQSSAGYNLAVIVLHRLIKYYVMYVLMLTSQNKCSYQVYMFVT